MNALALALLLFAADPADAPPHKPPKISAAQRAAMTPEQLAEREQQEKAAAVARPLAAMREEFNPPPAVNRNGGKDWGGILGDSPAPAHNSPYAPSDPILTKPNKSVYDWEEFYKAKAKQLADAKQRRRNIEMGLPPEGADAKTTAAAKKKYRDWLTKKRVLQRAQSRAGSRDTSGMSTADTYVNQAQQAVRQVQGR